MKRVLIVSPHFPPINAPDHQRIRMSLPYFKKFGWQPTMLTVKTRCVEDGLTDPLLARTVPEDLDVTRVGAIPFRLTSLIGARSLALRAFPTIRRAGSRLLKGAAMAASTGKAFDLVFFSTTQFPVMILGPMWKQKFEVPYVVDFQDPWLSDYYECNTDKTPPGGRFKYGLVQQIAGRLEPRVVRNADHIVCVSNAYVETFGRRYPDVSAEKFTVLPFGAPEFDFSSLKHFKVEQSVFSPNDGKQHWIYAGRGGRDMSFAVRAFFTALKRHVNKHPEQADRLRIHFVGTDYAPKERALKTIEPLARELGVDGIVTEQTQRLPYFETLRCLSDAHALFIPGSDDPGYTASKLYPYILAKKPLLAVFHKNSSVVDVIRETRAGRVVTFDGKSSLSEVADAIHQRWFVCGPLETPDTDWQAFAPYTARSMTQRLCEVFDRVVASDRRS